MEDEERNTSIHDLPLIVLKDILLQARGRPIPGTNRFAAVCGAWRGESPTEENELQLYLDKAAVKGKQLQRVTEWLAQHGEGVAAVELPITTWGFVRATLGFPGLSSSLQRLDIRGTNTLVGLLAAQVQLPNLQHLTACLSQDQAWQVDPALVLLEEGQQATGTLHPLQQACPGLKELFLQVNCEWGHMQQPTFSNMDALLPRLLPPTLQRLCLESTAGVDDVLITPHLALGDLTALQHLELRHFRITDPTSFLSLPAQCTLRLAECFTWHADLPTPRHWLPLRERLTAVTLDIIDGDAAVVPQLTRLTSLWVNSSEWEEGMELPLAGLSALRQLHLEADRVGRPEERVQQALLQVTDTSSLQHLSLATFGCGSPALLAAVGALTQLTFLCLSMDERVQAKAAGAVQGPPGQQQGQVGDAQLVDGLPRGPLWALHDLVGLQQLQLSEMHLLWYPATWLSHLTQLTLLVVHLNIKQGRDVVLSSRMASVVSRLQGSHPASLKQLVLYLQGAPVSDVVPSPLPGVSVGVRPDPNGDGFAVPRAPRAMQPCPHLPGLGELLSASQ